MKYWLITTEFPPIHGGGISTYCWHTAKMLAENNHDVTVFINDFSVKSVKVEPLSPGIRTIRFKPEQLSDAKVLGFEARLSMEFAHMVGLQMDKEGPPDILETQDYLGIGYYIQQKKFLLYPNFERLNIIVTVHAPSYLYLKYNQVPHYKFPAYWTGEMEKSSIMMADLVISPSNYIIEELKSDLRIGAKKPIQIFNPFRVDRNSDVLSFVKDDIVFFGKLTPQKGCLEMLSYLTRMWDNGFKKSISIIGGGAHFFYPAGEDMLSYVKKKYSQYIKEGLIKFEGNLKPNQLWERLKKAHVIITPSIVDNLPYAVLEAMSIGKTVLCSANGGHTEILNHEESGFIFHHEKEYSFENELLKILSLSNKELETIGKNAIEAIEKNCNYSIVCSQKVEAFQAFTASIEKKKLFPFIEEIPKKPINFPIKAEKNLLSIVVPYFNLGRYLEDTLSSLQKINYKNVEILVINDGSTDQDSIKKLHELEKKFSIRVYTNKNKGLSASRNFGAEQSKGEYLAFLDADDTVSPNYYSRSIEILAQYDNVSFVGCWAQYFGESSYSWPTFNPEPPYLLTHNMINSSALVYKRSDFLAFGLNDPKMLYGMEDYDSVISMVKNGARGISIPELWWQYRIRKNSMAQSFTTNKELYLYRLIAQKHNSFIKEYSEQIVNLLNQNGPGINFNNPTVEIEPSHRINQKLKEVFKKNLFLRRIAKRALKILGG